jgi:hypothetical protein
MTTATPGKTGLKDQEKIEAFTAQIHVEDGLFNTRTTLFLTPSGVLFAAYGWQQAAGPVRIGISILGLVVAVIWFLSSMQVNAAITALHKRRAELKQSAAADSQVERKDDPNAVVHDALFGWPIFRPTILLAWWLPWLFIVTWSVFLVWALRHKL